MRAEKRTRSSACCRDTRPVPFSKSQSIKLLIIVSTFLDVLTPIAQRRQEVAQTRQLPFPVALDVNGAARHPLYAFLTAQPTQPDGPGDIQWNFAKFLIDRSGNVAARFAPTAAPVSEEIVSAIERTL